jgi:hypothetical protein
MSAGSGVRVTVAGTTVPALTEKLTLVSGRTLVRLITVLMRVCCSRLTETCVLARLASCAVFCCCRVLF